MIGSDGESATSVVAYGYVKRRLAVVSPKQKALRIDATTDTRWRERCRSSRKIYADKYRY
jgi:hypothetical protein